MCSSDLLDSLELLPRADLLVAFNSDDVIIDDEGDPFLAGPVIVFKVENGDIVPLTEDEMNAAQEILKVGTAMLQGGRIRIYAYGL